MMWLLLAQLLTVKVSPSVCLAPCSTKVTVHFEPHERNQSISLELEGGDYYRYSEIDIQHHPPTFDVWYKDVPAGEYELRVALMRDHQNVATTRNTISVKGDADYARRKQRKGAQNTVARVK